MRNWILILAFSKGLKNHSYRTTARMANKLISVNTWESKAWQKKRDKLERAFSEVKSNNKKEKKIKKKESHHKKTMEHLQII